jgi:hypothetical protein
MVKGKKFLKLPLKSPPGDAARPLAALWELVGASARKILRYQHASYLD